MVIKDCVLKGTEILRASGIDNPMLDARILLCHVLQKDQVYLVVNQDTEVSRECEDEFFGYVKRRASHEPTAYITGEKEFMSLKFYVNKNVLIPRPDTEHLAELGIHLIRERGFSNVADFCTGSGALAVSVGVNCPDAVVTGYDVSDDALEVAKRNAKANNAENVSFKNLDVLDIVSGIDEKFDMVISNPPYIDAADMKTLDKTVGDYEPHIALYGGEDGLDFYRKISADAHVFLKDGGVLAFEVGHNQADAVSEIMHENFTDVQIKRDYADIKRVVWGILK